MAGWSRRCSCPARSGRASTGWSAALAAVLVRLRPPSRVAVTMTGELVDFFPDRQAGVAQLLATLPATWPDADCAIWAGRRGFVPVVDAAARTAEIASANWLASATLVARRVEHGLFVDLGSTTTDIVVLAGGEVRAEGLTDRERLATGELVYTGLTRTPVMALAAEAPFAGRRVALMNELFATSADLYRILGLLPEEADQHAAADGGPKTVGGQRAAPRADDRRRPRRRRPGRLAPPCRRAGARPAAPDRGRHGAPALARPDPRRGPPDRRRLRSVPGRAAGDRRGPPMPRLRRADRRRRARPRLGRHLRARRGRGPAACRKRTVAEPSGLALVAPAHLWPRARRCSATSAASWPCWSRPTSPWVWSSWPSPSCSAASSTRWAMAGRCSS